MDNSLANKARKLDYKSPCILNSLDPVDINLTHKMSESDEPIFTCDLESLNLLNDIKESVETKSVHLLNDNENLLLDSEQKFLSELGIEKRKKIKVVAIFGNTGEGKSHTLNHAFFDGEDIFKTSTSQISCTMGVWAMFNQKYNVLFLDTEGLLGISKREQQRTRLLLKVLAISDIIIYRTRAERLQRDMFTFLGGASKAYKAHFSKAFQQFKEKNDLDRSVSLGPGLIIFHETRHTEILNGTITESAEDIIRNNFAELKLEYDSFSLIKYVGIQTKEGSTSYKLLQVAVFKELESTKIRSPRDVKYVYMTLKSLNEKFNSKLVETKPELYMPAFFTCQERCNSCNSGCTLSMGHKDDGEPHDTSKNCEFQHQFQNCIYLCKNCYMRGQRTVVVPSYKSITDKSWTSLINYVWSGYVISCKKCGEIYRSRQHWYGNKDPEECAVIPEIVHIWPGDKHYFQENTLLGSQNAAQKILDSVTHISDTVASIGSQPTKLVTTWMADQIAPSYWTPNYQIKECFKCKSLFGPNLTKHHCRKCGEGFCEDCSSKSMPVPAQGWHHPVRVCDSCYQNSSNTVSTEDITASGSGTNEVIVRQIGETVLNSMQAVKSVLEIPKGFIKDSARPRYWTPDNECITCTNCNRPFGVQLLLHHCRKCGKGVCDDCSQGRKVVPLRGWDFPVRVCDNCLCS